MRLSFDLHDFNNDGYVCLTDVQDMYAALK